MADSQVAIEQRDFYLRIEISDADPVDIQAVISAIESLGGTPAEQGYCFSSAERRAAAIEVLGEKFGSRYFAVAD